MTDIINDSWHIYIAASRLHRRLVWVEMVMAVEFGTSPVPDSMLANCGNHSCTDTVYLHASIWQIGWVHFGNLRKFNANMLQMHSMSENKIYRRSVTVKLLYKVQI